MFNRSLLLSFLFVACFTQMIIGQDTKVDSYLEELISDDHNPKDCLISFNNNSSIEIPTNFSKAEKGQLAYKLLQENAQEAQLNVIQKLKEKQVPFQSFVIVNCIHAKLDAELIKKIASYPEVKKIMFNPSVRLEVPMEVESVDQREPEPEWGIKMINADQVWSMGYTGEGVVVGGQDTGYEWDHEVLKNKYRGYNIELETADHNYNWHDAIMEINPLHQDTLITDMTNPCGLDLKIPCDDNNHGTHTMGTMVGSDTLNAIGVAPNAKWIACRNMERGYGTPATYLDCFEWFLAPTDLNGENPDPSKAPHVINNSWSCPEMEGCNESNWGVLEEAVNNLKSAGVVVVVSAGNSGPGCNTINTPSAIFENSFTVGATAINDTIAGFSSRGAITVDGSLRLKPNVSAPGVNVRSCIRNNQYRNFSGTSMAGPHVAGAVALLISASPNLAGQVEKIESILEETSVVKTDSSECMGLSGEEIPNHVYGFGRIDIYAAVQRALELAATEDLSIIRPIKVFPNPGSDLVTIGIHDREDTTISFINSVGQLVAKQEVRSHVETFDVSPYPAGVYFFSIKLRGKRYFEKFVKVD